MEPPVPRLGLITIYVLTERTETTVGNRSSPLIVNYRDWWVSAAIPQKR